MQRIRADSYTGPNRDPNHPQTDSQLEDNRDLLALTTVDGGFARVSAPTFPCFDFEPVSYPSHSPRPQPPRCYQRNQRATTPPRAFVRGVLVGMVSNSDRTLVQSRNTEK